VWGSKKIHYVYSVAAEDGGKGEDQLAANDMGGRNQGGGVHGEDSGFIRSVYWGGLPNIRGERKLI